MIMQKQLLLLFFSFLFIRSFAISHRTLALGETCTISCSSRSPENFDYMISGNAIAVELSNVTSSTVTVRITAIAPGYGSFSFDAKSAGYIFHVVDVTNIIIPDNLSFYKGENYTYNPIILDAEATPALTWTSSNNSVATVSSAGVVSTIGTGQTVITCKAPNGVSALSVITVNPVLVSSVNLNKHEYQMNVGEYIQPTVSVLPANATSTNVKWMTTNENIAQVDDNGKITAIAPGYCSVFCIADDSSRKFDKCLIHVQGAVASRADVNGDGQVSVTDAFTVIDVILNNP